MLWDAIDRSYTAKIKHNGDYEALDSKYNMPVKNEYVTAFEINTEVKQGDRISPMLFNIVIGEALKETLNGPGVNIRAKLIMIWLLSIM